MGGCVRTVRSDVGSVESQLRSASYNQPADVVPSGYLEAVTDRRLCETSALRVKGLIASQQDGDGPGWRVTDGQQHGVAGDGVAVEPEASTKSTPRGVVAMRARLLSQASTQSWRRGTP